MSYAKKFNYSPGGDDTSGSTPLSNEEELRKEETENLASKTEADDQNKPLGEKIKEALQDWANKDESDQAFDDTRV